MTDKRLLIHAVFLMLAPFIAAWFGLSSRQACWRWLVVLSGFSIPEKSPVLVLGTISISHFVEKVRWSMDRHGVYYG